jgi:hypothetical protein
LQTDFFSKKAPVAQILLDQLFSILHCPRFSRPGLSQNQTAHNLRREQYMNQKRLLLTALLGIFAFAFQFAAKANDSLYDSSSAQTLDHYPMIYFGPKADGIRYDKRMIKAAQIAQMRAHGSSTSRCWHYVKEALMAAQVVTSRPGTEYAKQAGNELINKFGFKKTRIANPFEAPVGAVLVYGGPGAGHVEIRTWTGFVSDFESRTPSKRPLLGVYVKPS